MTNKQHKTYFIVAVTFLVILIIIPLVSAQFGGSCGSPNWVPYGEKQIVKYFKNSEGICDREIQNVECASNYDCQLTNQVCDTNIWSCVDADVNLQGETYESDQIIEAGDNVQNNSNTSALIIALGIIAGLVILGLLIRKRKI